MNRRSLLRSLAGLVAGGAIAKRTAAVGAADDPIVSGIVRPLAPTVYVGEDGPELIRLPTNARVVRFGPRMEPGRTYCDRCDASAFPRFGWQGPGHVAVRLWHDDHELRYRQMPTFATVDGEPVSMVMEAMAGDPGWIIRHVTYQGDRERLKPCMQCFLGELCEVGVGKVELEQPNWVDEGRALQRAEKARERAIARAWEVREVAPGEWAAVTKDGRVFGWCE